MYRFVEDYRFGLDRIIDVRLCHQYLVDTGHRGQSFLYGISRFAQIFCRVDQAIENNQVIDEGSRIDTAVVAQDQRSSVPKDNGYRGCSQKFAHRVCHLLAPVDARNGLAELLIGLFEAMLYLGFRVESLDNP